MVIILHTDLLQNVSKKVQTSLKSGEVLIFLCGIGDMPVASWLWNCDFLIALKLQWGFFWFFTDFQFIVYFKFMICVSSERLMGKYILVLLGNTVIICGCNCVGVIQCCIDLENLGLWKCHSFVIIYL